MRRILGVIAAMMAFGAINSPGRNINPNPVARIPKKVLKKRSEIFEAERNELRGLKKFTIGGREVWAINEKNAIRKAGQAEQKHKQMMDI